MKKDDSKRRWVFRCWDSDRSDGGTTVRWTFNSTEVKKITDIIDALDYRWQEYEFVEIEDL